MGTENEAKTAKTAKGVQVSAVVPTELVERIDDYRFDKQLKERTNVKRSDVVRDALEAFFAETV